MCIDSEYDKIFHTRFIPLEYDLYSDNDCWLGHVRVRYVNIYWGFFRFQNFSLELNLTWTARPTLLDELRIHMRSSPWFDRSTECGKWKWRTLDETLWLLKIVSDSSEVFIIVCLRFDPRMTRMSGAALLKRCLKPPHRVQKSAFFSTRFFISPWREITISFQQIWERDYSSERYFSCVPKTDHTDWTEVF